jgi:hypothetical protein
MIKLDNISIQMSIYSRLLFYKTLSQEKKTNILKTKIQ